MSNQKSRLILRVYYAHNKIIYNTKRERDEYEYILAGIWRPKVIISGFPAIDITINNILKSTPINVICPNNDIGEMTDPRKPYTGDAMRPYLSIVRWSDIVIASEYRSTIGRGVYQEIKLALHLGIPAFVLRTSKRKYQLRKIKSIAIVDEDSWIRYGKIKI